MTSDIIWTPSAPRINAANITAFSQIISQKYDQIINDYFDLHDFSVTSPAEFWREIAEFTGAEGDFSGAAMFDESEMFDAHWFPDAKLNYAQTMLRFRGDAPAIVFQGEDKAHQSLTRDELYNQVSQIAQFLRAQGVKRGDRVAGFVANTPQALVAMLAAASIGAIWSSCSPDFGRQGVLDRFGQIEPKVLFAVDGYYYNGKTHSCVEKIADFLTDLPTIEATVVISYIGETDLATIPNAKEYANLIHDIKPAEIDFEPLPFDHPLFILYSSGTTGAPKCIVHGHGGTLLQHLKEHQLHSDIKEGDKVFYFTTCSWMMWNWLVSAIGTGATIMLYDGSPFYPGPEVLWDYAEREGFTFFGTSAKYIEAIQKAGYEPAQKHDLGALRAMASTGSPLSAEGYDFVYKHIKSDLHLASISGGTDIVSCFVLGVPTLPVRRGEIQAPGLGMAVEVWTEDGQPVAEERGELVCTKSFPSRPVFFWKDEGRRKYHAAYFERFGGIWAHGDFAEITAHKGVIIYGRSDAVLNPGGVRIGTAEIYRQVDKVESVLESIVIGQEWDNDVRVVLFVKMKDGVELTDEIRAEIKQIIRKNTTPRHVPAKILQVADIPRTKSGKIVEIPVRDVVHGKEVKNKEALANPEALELYKNRAELAE